MLNLVDAKVVSLRFLLTVKDESGPKLFWHLLAFLWENLILLFTLLCLSDIFHFHHQSLVLTAVYYETKNDETEFD